MNEKSLDVLKQYDIDVYKTLWKRRNAALYKSGSEAVS